MRPRAIGALIALALLVSAVTPAVEADRKARKRALDHYRKGDKALQRRDLGKAETEFRAAIAEDDLLVPAHYGLAQTLMATKRYADAIPVLERCKTATQDLAGLFSSNAAVADQRRQEEIQALKETINALQSGAAKSLDSEREITRIQQRISDLERMLNREEQDDKPPAFVHLSLGSCHLRLGHAQDAEREFLLAIAADPMLGEAHNNLAVLYMLSGRLEESAAELALAEGAGFAVNPQFKSDLESRRAAAAR